MTGLGTSHVVLWLADLFLLSSVLLVLAFAAFAILRQPARRMTVARSTAWGLAALATLTLVPGWPRHCWRTNWRPQEPNSVSPSPRFSPSRAGGGVAMLDRHASPSRRALAPVAVPEREVALTETPGPTEGPIEPAALPMPVGAALTKATPAWSSLLVAAYFAGCLLSAAWLLLGAAQAAILRRRSHEASESLKTLLRECLSKSSRAPRLRLSSQIAQPVALGFLRPMILLPEQFVAKEPEDRIRKALAHESAHIGNGDLALAALCRLLLPFFHAQPLYWLLRRQIGRDQEALADAAAASRDRTQYAEILLDWARTMAARPPSSYAAALGLWERPSQLRRRIALLLDSSLVIERTATRRWRLFTWGVGGALVVGLSLASIRPRPQPAAPSHQVEKPAAEADFIVFQGRVLAPDGKPFAGAKVYLHCFRDTMGPRPLEPRATSAADGRFRFTAAKAHFRQPEVFAPWNYSPVVAVAQGFGLGVSDSDEPDANRNVSVRLARDDVPIRGRLIDLEGRPVAGARIRVEHVATSPRNDLTPFLTAARKSKVRIYELRSKYLSRDIQFTESFHPIPSATSDSDGRFVVPEIGREREVSLMVEGATIRWTEVSALTRPGPAIRIVDLKRKNDPWVETYQGAEFQLTLAPSRPYEGFVRDRDTGRGVSGVSIESFRLADNPIANYRRVKATTDDNGHFRLEGMPIGVGNEVVLMPPEDEPYLASHQKLRFESGLGPIAVDFVLKRGVWARGKVMSKSDRKPMRALLRYVAAADNPYVNQAPGFRDLFFNGDYSYARETEPDGSYRIAVLPGRGLLAIELQEREYYAVDDPAAGKPDLHRFVPFLYGYDQFSSEIDAREDRELIHDFALNLARARTLEGQVLDPLGAPLTGSRYLGMTQIDWWTPEPLKNSTFTITGLRPPAPRTLSRLLQIRDVDALSLFLMPEDTRPVAFVHEGKHLAGFTEIGWNTLA
jgi:beta-lactamase regulating signal transducer with metallopeptidase domain